MFVKLCLNDEMRRVSVDTVAFEPLEETVRTAFPALKGATFQLLWRDDEGDLVTVSNNTELTEAISFMEDTGMIIKFTVKPKDSIESPTNTTPEAEGEILGEDVSSLEGVKTITEHGGERERNGIRPLLSPRLRRQMKQLSPRHMQILRRALRQFCAKRRKNGDRTMMFDGPAYRHHGPEGRGHPHHHGPEGRGHPHHHGPEGRGHPHHHGPEGRGHHHRRRGPEGCDFRSHRGIFRGRGHNHEQELTPTAVMV